MLCDFALLDKMDSVWEPRYDWLETDNLLLNVSKGWWIKRRLICPWVLHRAGNNGLIFVLCVLCGQWLYPYLLHGLGFSQLQSRRTELPASTIPSRGEPFQNPLYLVQLSCLRHRCPGMIVAKYTKDLGTLQEIHWLLTTLKWGLQGSQILCIFCNYHARASVPEAR